jgi:alpha-mannosidase
LIVTALKRAEDGNGYILRLYEAEGHDTQAKIDFSKMTSIKETDILERPLSRHPLVFSDHSATFFVGHNQIITLRILTDF